MAVSDGYRVKEEPGKAVQSEMVALRQEIALLRMVEQAMHLGFVVAQDYRTREVMLFAANGKLFVHEDVAMIRDWLRHYAQCGTFGRRCFVGEQHVCGCVPGLQEWSGGKSF